MYSATIYNVLTGERKTVSEASREVLIGTLGAMLEMGWHIEEFH